MSTRLRLLAAAATLALGAFASVGAQAVEINYWSQFDDPDQVALFERLVAEFETANPDVDVNITTMQRDDMTTQLRVALGAGAGPDVANYDVGDAYLGSLVRAGLVKDISATFSERGWNERFFPWAIEAVTYDDKQWGIPAQQEGQGLWYNAALFREKGWAPPTDWASFIAAAEAAKADGLIAYAHGTATPGIASQTISNIVYGLIPADIVTDASTMGGKGTWADDPRFLQAVQTYVDWMDKGWLPADQNALTLDDFARIFVQGKAAMTDMGPWMASLAVESWKEGTFEPLFVPMPAQNTSFPLTNQGAPGSGVFVSNAVDDEKLKTALDFVEFMFIRPESQKAWLLEANILPVTNEEIDPAEFPNPVLASVWQAHEVLGEQGGVSGQWLDQFVDPEVGELFNANTQRLAAKAMTAEEFITQLAAATKAARGQ